MNKQVKASVKQVEMKQKSKSNLGNIQTKLPPDMVGEIGKFQATQYFITYHIQDNNTFEASFSLLDKLKPLCKKYIFAEEYGKTGNTPHIQGGIVLKKKMYAKTIEKFFKDGVTLQKLKKWDFAKDYCSKEGNRIQCSEKVRKPLKDYFDKNQMKPFQRDILELIKTPPTQRDIYWYWESCGGVGKTVLARHICMNNNAIFVSGKNADIKYAVSEYTKHNDCDVLIVNLTMAQENNAPYDALEAVKDGIFFSGKYESKDNIFNIPHIIVFANFPPKTTLNGRIKEQCIENFSSSDDDDLMFTMTFD